MGERGGPSVRLVLSCDGCMYERAEKYAVQGDSGHDVSCGRFDPPKYIGDTTWSTPEWCPLRSVAIAEHIEIGRAHV